MTVQTPETDRSGLVADIEQELSALFRRSRSASLRLARRVHPDMDAAGYALISQIELGTASGGPGVRASDVAHALDVVASVFVRAGGRSMRDLVADPLPEVRRRRGAVA